MHEMSLMASIFEILKQHLPEEAQKVTNVTLVVGRLTNAVPDALQMAFEAFAHETKFEGAQLDIKVVPIKVKCQECALESEIDSPIFLCPACKSPVVEVLSGREMYIDSMEVE